MYSVELLTSYHGLELLNLSSVGFLMVFWHEYPEKETRLYYIKKEREKERKKKKTNRQTIFIQTVIIPVIIIFKMPILLNLHNMTLNHVMLVIMNKSMCLLLIMQQLHLYMQATSYL